MRSLNHLLRRSVNDETIQRVYRWLFARAHQLNRSKSNSKSFFGQFRSLIEQYHRNVPIEYLCGSAMFYHRLFHVNQHVLIPRRDSESLIDHVRSLDGSEQQLVLEIGTGSGCLAITLARLYPQWKIIACDISSSALRVARENAARHRCRNIEFYRGNLFDEKFLVDRSESKFDLIISNPPYISRKELFQCDQSILHEPHRALFVDPPLKFYLEILRRAKENWLKTNGHLVFECSPMNIDALQTIFLHDENFSQLKISFDTNDLPRVVSIRKEKSQI